MNQKGLSGFKNLTSQKYEDYIFQSAFKVPTLQIYFTNDFAFSTAAANPERSFPPAVA